MRRGRCRLAVALCIRAFRGNVAFDGGKVRRYNKRSDVVGGAGDVAVILINSGSKRQFERKAEYPTLLRWNTLPLALSPAISTHPSYTWSELTLQTTTYIYCVCVCVCVCISRPSLAVTHASLNAKNRISALDGQFRSRKSLSAMDYRTVRFHGGQTSSVIFSLWENFFLATGHWRAKSFFYYGKSPFQRNRNIRSKLYGTIVDDRIKILSFYQYCSLK